MELNRCKVSVDQRQLNGDEARLGGGDDDVSLDGYVSTCR